MLKLAPFRKPAIDGIPLNGFKPAQPNQISILSITNDGFSVKTSRSGQRGKFYDYFLAEARKLVEAHGDAPQKTRIEQFCDEINKQNEL